MVQHDYDLADATGAAFRADGNLLFQAIASMNSGATEPATKFANMGWFDTANNLMKVRKEDNSGWITIAEKTATEWKPYWNTALMDAAFQAKDATLASLAAVAGVIGDILYASGTDAWARLAKGTDGEVLTLASGIPSWATLVSLSRHTAIATTSGTTHDFTGLDAGLNRITCMFSGVSLNGTDELMIRLGDAGGIEPTGYISTASVSGGDDQGTVGFLLNKSNADADVWHGLVILARQDGNTWEISGSITAGGNNHSWCSGGKTLTAELTQLRLMTTGSNAFDAGSFNILTE